MSDKKQMLTGSVSLAEVNPMSVSSGVNFDKISGSKRSVTPLVSMTEINQMLTPSAVKFEKVSGAEHQSRIILEPFERGYGVTLGNALRRILLSSMPGCAVTEVSFGGSVLHEFSTIEGVQEDVVDILLNLKELSIKVFTGNDVLLTLNKTGPCVVTAADIVLGHGQEIVNPDLVIPL